MKIHSVAAICGILALVGPQAASAQCVVGFPSTQNFTAGNRFLGTAATSQSDVWAVGSVDRSNHAFTTGLVEHFNGTSWSVVPAPSPSGAHSVTFQGATALSPNDAWMVGSTQVPHPIAEHWDGSTWSLAFAQDMSDESLVGVSGHPSNPNLVIAVGCLCLNGTAGLRPVAEMWNGVSWTRSFPPYPQDTGILTAVSTTAAGTAWAVGQTGYKTLIDHWNGATWIRVNGAYNGLGNLTSVTAIDDNDVYIVGHRDQPYPSFIEHWDGTSWSFVSFPNNHNKITELSAVAASSPSDIWIAGRDFPVNTHRVDLTYLAHWNGIDWTTVDTPSENTDNHINGITAAAGFVSVVGNAESGMVVTPSQNEAFFSNC